MKRMRRTSAGQAPGGIEAGGKLSGAGTATGGRRRWGRSSTSFIHVRCGGCSTARQSQERLTTWPPLHTCRWQAGHCQMRPAPNFPRPDAPFIAYLSIFFYVVEIDRAAVVALGRLLADAAQVRSPTRPAAPDETGQMFRWIVFGVRLAGGRTLFAHSRPPLACLAPRS